ncbi:MAG: 30S ribosomal protein S5 [Candidatus Aerophobetes bacterium]|nr:30S ribosomal protein S5 [Candidatus Aerophobetes bacterium]
MVKENNALKEEVKAANKLEERLIRVRRVFTVVKGGRRIGFNALMVVGDRKGQVGLGLGKAKELVEAIAKGRKKAEKNLIRVPLRNNTIPYQVTGKYGASRVFLKPASPGTGVIAGEAVRAIVELAGVKDILTKSLGNNNSLNLSKATLEGLKKLKDLQRVLQLRGV